MAREDNDAEREKIITSMSEQKPDVLILLGDMVFDGSDKSQWNQFASLMKPLRNLKIPFYPVLGNHEYWGPNVDALRNVSQLFPQFKKSHWYSVVYDSLGFIFLDSNNSEYSTTEWDEQKHWFEDKISEFDNNPNVLGVFVFLHHPPYTNSLVTGDAVSIQLAFCPAFKSSKKTLAMFSGHAHTFEKFFIDNKYFIVSGGGGGPRVKLATGPQYHHDLCHLPSPRPFHYIMLERIENQVHIMVNAIDKGGSRFYRLDDFVLNFHE